MEETPLFALEQTGLAALRDGQAEMGVPAAVEAPAACRAGDEAKLNEISIS